jgi:hypothetical protein
MMKTNAKRKNSAAKKLIPAAGMLALSASMLATSTYAWFTLNKEVTVTGMQVNTTVGSNLMIAKTTTDATTALTDGDFKTSDVDIMSALLEPVSTINGKNFYYTSTGNVNGLGDAMADTYIDYNTIGLGAASESNNYNNAFSQNYGILKTSTPDTATGYIDYAFQLKANNTTNSDQYINVTGFDLTYGGTETTEHAYRAAMFVEDIGTSLKATKGGADVLTTILAPTPSGNDTAAGYYFASGKAVKDEDELDSVSNLSTAANIATVSAGTTHYYKVVVRLWLEGEDQTCNNSVFNTLKEKWALSLKINMEDATTNAVTSINRTATAQKTAIAAGTTIDANGTTIVIDNVTYYPITGTSNPVLYKTANTVVAATDTIYKIVNNHPIDVTNQINITTT